MSDDSALRKRWRSCAKEIRAMASKASREPLVRADLLAIAANYDHLADLAGQERARPEHK